MSSPSYHSRAQDIGSIMRSMGPVGPYAPGQRLTSPASQLVSPGKPGALPPPASAPPPPPPPPPPEKCPICDELLTPANRYKCVRCGQDICTNCYANVNPDWTATNTVFAPLTAKIGQKACPLCRYNKHVKFYEYQALPPAEQNTIVTQRGYGKYLTSRHLLNSHKRKYIM